jgi:predicted transcriptional regulator
MQQILDRMPANACLTLPEIREATGVSNQHASVYVGRLVSRNLLERVERGCFQLTAEGRQAQAEGREIKSGPNAKHIGPRKPPRQTLTARAWRAMRAQRGKPFTVADLLEAIATGDEKDPADTVRRYLKVLKSAGYVRQHRKRRPDGVFGSQGLVRYSLIRDTGPKHPIPRANRTVLHDPNTDERIRLTPGGEV